MKKRSQNVLFSIIGFSLASWISAALNFIVLPISTRVFNTTELAKVNLFYSVVTIVMNFTCFGLDQGYVRFFSEYKSEKEKKGLFSVCLYGSSVVLLILIILAIPFSHNLSYWITGVETNNLIIIELAICLLTQLVYRYICLYYRLQNTVISYTVFAVLSSAIIKISYLISASFNATGEAAIFVMSITSLLFLIIVTIPLRSKITWVLDYKHYINRDVFKYCIPLIPVTFLIQINTYIPQYAIRYFGNFSELGVFSTAVTLSSILTLIQSGINVVWSPYVFANHDKDLNNIWKLQRIISLIVVACGIGLMLFKDLIVLILGNNYRGAVRYLPLLIVAPVLSTISETTGVGTLLEKKGYINLLISLVGIVVNCVAAVLFTKFLGAIGAAMSSAITAFAVFLLKTILGQKYFKSVENIFSFTIIISMLVITSVIFTVDNGVLPLSGVLGSFFLLYIGYKIIGIGKECFNRKV